MPLLTPLAFKEALSSSGRLLGLDLGEKTIGLALSDTRRTIATPRQTLHRTTFKGNLRQIVALMEIENIQGIVLGLPLNMNGTEGPRCQSTRQFAKNFLSLHDVLLTLWDERLSTKAADDALLHFDLSRKKRAAHIDKTAASFMLQGFLDFLNGSLIPLHC